MGFNAVWHRQKQKRSSGALWACVCHGPQNTIGPGASRNLHPALLMYGVWLFKNCSFPPSWLFLFTQHPSLNGYGWCCCFFRIIIFKMVIFIIGYWKGLTLRLSFLQRHTFTPSSGTSDYERNASDFFGLLGVLHRVDALVSLAHSVYDEVTKVLVDFDPAVDHDAAAHQNHIGRAWCGSVPKRDLQPGGGQQDVEVLPMEQSVGVLIDWFVRWREEERIGDISNWQLNSELQAMHWRLDSYLSLGHNELKMTYDTN